jgi:hypothetical protein
VITVSIKHNIDQVVRELQANIPKAIEAAQISALNKTADGAKTRMVRAISSTYKINQSVVREKLFISRATRKGGATFTAALLGSGKPSMNVIRFLEAKVTLAEAKRRRKSGTLNELRFQILRAGGLKTIDGAFIGNKGRTVFRRTGKSRLPIEPIQTIDIPGMFRSRKNTGEVTSWIQDNFNRIFERELKFYLGKYAK